MLIENDMLLYHGSYTKVIDIDLNESFVGKDFGKGFYLTQNKLQARQFIKTSVLKAQNKGIISGKQKFGYVNIYKLMSKTIDKLSVYEFEDITDESTIKIVTSMLLPDKLDYQYCFKTKRAIKCLEFVEAKKYEV